MYLQNRAKVVVIGRGEKKQNESKGKNSNEWAGFQNICFGAGVGTNWPGLRRVCNPKTKHLFALKKLYILLVSKLLYKCIIDYIRWKEF